MPVTLPLLSRRAFLASSLATGLSLAACAARRPKRMAPVSRLALLADTHIAADKDAQPVNNVNLWQNTSCALRDVLSFHSGLTAALVLGDCAFSTGLPAEYERFIEAMTPLGLAGLPVHLLAGNHDERARLLQAAAALPSSHSSLSPLPGHLVECYSLPQADLYLLDSLYTLRGAPGELGAPQLQWLDETLAQRPHRHALVCLHHHPQFAFPDIPGLLDTDRLIAILQRHPQVKALIYGHTHCWSASRLGPLHLINLPPVSYVFAEHAPAGWMYLTLDDRGATFELRSLDPTHPDHARRLLVPWT